VWALVYMRVCAYVCARASIGVRVRGCTCAFLRVCVCVCAYVRVCLKACVSA
jgi:hypothetical protein